MKITTGDNMETLRQLLEAENIKVKDLEGFIAAMGYDSKNLNDDQVQQVYDKIKSQKGNTSLSKEVSTGKAKTVSPVESLKTDLGKGLREVNAELDQMTLTIQEVVNTVVESKAQSMFGLIKSIPQLTSSRVKQLIDASNGDMTFFRQSSTDLKASLLSEFGIE